MCGIWGFATSEKLPTRTSQTILKSLLILSASNRKEAAGVSILSNENICNYASELSSHQMVRQPEYQLHMDRFIAQEPFCAIGYSKGSQEKEGNSQPVHKHQMMTVYSGIIANAKELWGKIKPYQDQGTDTRLFAELYEHYRQQGSTQEAFRRVYHAIYGMTSTLSILPDTQQLVAATNNASLYYCLSENGRSIIFASESVTLKKMFRSRIYCKNHFSESSIQQLQANTALLIDLVNMGVSPFTLPSCCHGGRPQGIPLQVDLNHYRHLDIDDAPIRKLRRCTRCVLPETMPFIEFDKEGVCNYCRTYKKHTYQDKNELSVWAEKQRRKSGEADSIVAFSGGRDSSYGLHYFVKELGLHPVSYAYDWGMVTDLAQRNQSRMCAALGVEFILVSADIQKKRRNIQKNVAAWLKKPDLGMVPLFMAGDKHYFYYANKEREKYGLDTVLMASNPFEKTFFKAGFCGVKPAILRSGESLEVEEMRLVDIFRMTGHYMGQFITNPRYINRSLWDTATATASYYVIPHNYFRLFNYIPWDEDMVNDVLIQEYDWEVCPDTESTWRIGDGTAPFYNYIYYQVAGFTENDTLRSNQIREGLLSREKALEYVYRDNAPRFDSMQWYFDVLGLDLETALRRVREMPRLYGK